MPDEMLSSSSPPSGSSDPNLNHNHTNISSSSSSSSPPFPSFQPPKPNNNSKSSKTMEEMWKDISLSSIHDHTRRGGGGGGDQFLDLSVTTNSSSSSRLLHHQNPNFIFQDFLARPLSNNNKDPPTRIISSSRGEPTLTSGIHGLYGGSSSPIPPPAAPPPPPPATVLSLYSGPPGFDFFDQLPPPPDHSHPHPLRPTSSNGSPFVGPFEGLDCASELMPCFGRNRIQEWDSSSGDRKHKRMIKNRESAARSRARKQAYTKELELEVAHLMEENARLRRQQEQEQLRLAAAAQLPRKRALFRTSTAPF